MQDADGKALVRELIEAVWRRGRLDALPSYWTEDCVNHADPSVQKAGLDALRRYHAQFADALKAFKDIDIAIVQQIAEGDRVVTHLRTRVTQVAPFLDLPSSGRTATLASIRIDRIAAGRIAEHWSVADLAGMLQQLRG